MLSLHKLLPVFLLPTGLTILLVALGLLLRRPKLAWLGVAVLWLCSTSLVGNAAMRAAEGWTIRQPIETAPQAAAVVVLSGGRVEPVGTSGISEWGEAVDRFDAGVQLVLAEKASVLILTGGWLPWRPHRLPEGDALAEIAVERGIPSDAILVTGPVSNTAAEAQAVAQIVADMPELANGPLLLVTSAYHMRRAHLLFEEAGLTVIDFPVDYQTQAGPRVTFLSFVPNARSLEQTELALREFYGYCFYRIMNALP